MIGPIDQMVEN